MALTVSQRAASYYAQRYAFCPDPPDWNPHPPALTGRQRRRIRHKRNHQISQALNRQIRRASQGS
jgi:hypothetical protein